MPDNWKDIRGFEGLYAVSEGGALKSLERMKPYRDGERKHHERIMSFRIIKGGYAQLDLCKNGIKRPYLVHRIVAETFVPNPKNLPQVNHKDGNKLNNCADNLEWCTAKENMIHSVKAGLRTDLKAVDALSKEGRYIATYPSIKEAARALGVNHQNISSCCHGRTRSCGGFVWRYSGEGNFDGRR